MKALGLAVHLAERRHLGRELEREAPLDEALLLLLVRAQQPIARLAHGRRIVYRRIEPQTLTCQNGAAYCHPMVCRSSFATRRRT